MNTNSSSELVIKTLDLSQTINPHESLAKKRTGLITRRDSDGEGKEFAMVEFHKSESPLTDDQTARSMMALNSAPARDRFDHMPSPTFSGGLSSPTGDRPSVDRAECLAPPRSLLRASNSTIRDDGVVAVALEESDEDDDDDEGDAMLFNSEHSGSPSRKEIKSPNRSLKFQGLLSKFQQNDGGASFRGSTPAIASTVDDPMSWLEMPDVKEPIKSLRSKTSMITPRTMR